MRYYIFLFLITTKIMSMHTAVHPAGNALTLAQRVNQLEQKITKLNKKLNCCSCYGFVMTTISTLTGIACVLVEAGILQQLVAANTPNSTNFLRG